jgi:hypothetical protein
MPSILTGSVRITGTDHENWPNTDEHIDMTHNLGFVLNVDQPAISLDVPHARWGGECRTELQVNARAVSDGAIQIEGEARFYEGGSECTDDLEDRKQVMFIVLRNNEHNTRATHHFIQLVNPGNGDHSEITFNVYNWG